MRRAQSSSPSTRSSRSPRSPNGRNNVTSGLRQNIPWLAVVGFFAGGIGGCCYQLFSASGPQSKPVRASDLKTPVGYTAETAPGDVPSGSLAASWRHGDSRVLVVRVKFEPIDASRVESLRNKVTSQLPNATIDRAEVRTVGDQQAAIVEASAASGHLRWAIVGSPKHATLVEQTSTRTDDHDVFDQTIMRVGVVMSQPSDFFGTPFDNWMLRGSMLGMILGVAITRLRTALALRAEQRARPAMP